MKHQVGDEECGLSGKGIREWVDRAVLMTSVEPNLGAYATGKIDAACKQSRTKDLRVSTLAPMIGKKLRGKSSSKQVRVQEFISYSNVKNTEKPVCHSDPRVMQALLEISHKSDKSPRHWELNSGPLAERRKVVWILKLVSFSEVI